MNIVHVQHAGLGHYNQPHDQKAFNTLEDAIALYISRL